MYLQPDATRYPGLGKVVCSGEASRGDRIAYQRVLAIKNRRYHITEGLGHALAYQ